MKILKKIVIGCLALIICFCSCFKFINAEALPDSVTLEQGKTYVLVVENSHLNNPELIVASNQELVIGYGGGQEVSELFGSNVVFFIPNSSIPVNVISELTFLKTENDYTYYSFFYSIPTSDVNYSDNSVAYFEEYQEPEVPAGFSVYDTIYNLIETYIFGGSIENGSHQDLTATTLSSIICILVFALPFLIIWKVLKVIMG